jgi:hypothetical protein
MHGQKGRVRVAVNLIPRKSSDHERIANAQCKSAVDSATHAEHAQASVTTNHGECTVDFGVEFHLQDTSAVPLAFGPALKVGVSQAFDFERSLCKETTSGGPRKEGAGACKEYVQRVGRCGRRLLFPNLASRLAGPFRSRMYFFKPALLRIRSIWRSARPYCSSHSLSP